MKILKNFKFNIQLFGGRGSGSSSGRYGGGGGLSEADIVDTRELVTTRAEHQAETDELLGTANELLRIVFFDENNKRNHVIERDKRTNEWHTHKGYFHAENGTAQHLWHVLLDKNMTKQDLRKVTGISTTTVQKLTKNESVGIDIILRICEKLSLKINDVVEFVEE